MAPTPEPGRPFSLTAVTLRVAVLSLLGIPLLAYIWETLNKVVAGDFSSVRLIVAIPVLLAFLLLLRVVAREVWRIEGERRA